jgi:chromosome segregation ATPase
VEPEEVRVIGRGKGDDLAKRLEALEATVATQAQIHVQVQQHIGALHAIAHDLTQKQFVQQQQLSITHRRTEEQEKRLATLDEMVAVLEREANDLRVDSNAYRNEIAGLSQRIDYVYIMLQRLGQVLTQEVPNES